jgi:hypothetical protein
MLMSMAMIAITTSNSIKVNADRAEELRRTGETPEDCTSYHDICPSVDVLSPPPLHRQGEKSPGRREQPLVPV